MGELLGEQQPSNFQAKLVHGSFSHPFFIRNAEIFEYLTTPILIRLIRHPGNDMEMDVVVFRRLRKLDHVGFRAARDFFERNRDPTDQNT